MLWLGYVDVEGFCLLGHDADVVLLFIEFKNALFDGKVAVG